jgi:P27 family predicted phage terminase small subunit
MKGRKPRLKLVQGDATTGQCPGPPAWLPPYAQDEWRRAAPELWRRGQLVPAVQALLEAFAVAAGQVRETEVLMAAEGRFLRADSGPVTHPAARLQSAAMREARLLAAELGLTRRSKGEVDAPPADRWEGLLA